MAEITIEKPSGQITFYEFFEPPLESGDYALTVTHTASSTDPGQAFNSTYSAAVTFAVLGPRFTLPAAYVHTLFPPADSQGEYSNVLPHAVFRRKTLPWQRLVEPEESNSGNIYPWLAVLCFDLYDPLPAVQMGTFADLQTPPAGTLSYPGLEPEVGESTTDPVQFIDVPVQLFADIAPTLSDLRWLAHAREIDTTGLGDKAASLRGAKSGSMPFPEFSVVVSNRLPSPGNQTLCCLVSFENMVDFLPATRGRIPTALASATNLRLAVLANWSFGAVELPETFAQYFDNLNDQYADVSTPQIPYANAQGTANAAVEGALAMSYTALNHHTRQGADTVSWYRGPFLPYSNPSDASASAASADALVRYDPSTGMFDESLAAAWQIGQLLALNDKDFSTTLYSWKRGETQAAVTDFETCFLAAQIAVDPALIANGTRPVAAGLMDQVIKPLLKKYLSGGGQ